MVSGSVVQHQHHPGLDSNLVSGQMRLLKVMKNTLSIPKSRQPRLVEKNTLSIPYLGPAFLGLKIYHINCTDINRELC